MLQCVWVAKGYVGNHLPSLLHLIPRGRVFQSSPELVDVGSHTSQLALGIPSLPVSEAGTAGRLSCPPSTSVGSGHGKLVSSCLHASALTTSISPAPSIVNFMCSTITI